MRYVILLLALAAVGVGAWAFLGDNGDTEDNTVYEPDEEPNEEARPELEGMRVDGGPAPDATDNPGRAEIVGSVRLAGEPVPARVELRVVARIESSGADAMFAVMGKVFVERLLDGGVARGGALDTAKAGDDGAFRFKGLGPGLYELRARDDDDRRAVASVSIPADGARVSATIELPSGDVSLKGRVVFDDGTPFRGTVIVSPGVGQMGPFMPARGPQAETDPEGYFAIGGLAPGPVMVTAIAPGSIRAMGMPITLPYEGDYVFTVGAGGVPVKGKVIAAETQEPVPGATVLAGGGNPSSGFLIRTTTADEEGRFELQVPGVEGGMLAMAPGYATSMVELRGERPEDLVVTLNKLGVVRGQLTAKESGEPLAGVPVYAIPAERMGGFAFSSSTRTGVDGRYEMSDVSPGPVMVFAFGEGWVSEGVGGTNPVVMPGRRTTGPTLTLKPGEEKDKDLKAIAAGTVEGRVTSAGKPVAGAVVTVQRPNDFMMGIAQMLGMGSGLVTSVTDRDGRYAIDAIVPDTDVRLSAKAVGFAAETTDPLTVASGERTTRDITLEAARWMTVTVVDAESGKPVPNAMVMARMKQAEGEMNGIRSVPQVGGDFFTTDAQGRARVGPLGEGAVSVRVQARGFLEKNDWTEFDAGATEGTIKLHRGLEISGRITLPAGVAASQVEIRARYSGDGGWQREETAPKPDGTFVIGGLKDGIFRVSARAVMPGKRFEAKVEGVEAGSTDVELELVEVERGSMLTVKVADAKGVPVARARISMSSHYKNGGHSSSSRGLSAGRASFELDEDRTPDEVHIEIFQVEGAQGGALYHGPIDYEGGEIELTLPPAETLSGRATSAGKPVAGVRAVARLIRPGTKAETSRDHGSAVSDEDGRWTIEGLGPYEYQVRFEVPATFEPAANQRVKAGSGSVDVDLVVGAGAVITVLDDSGDPVAGASVYAQKQGERGRRWDTSGMNTGRFNARTNSKGVAKLQGLPAEATYQLSVSPPNTRDDLRPSTLKAWTPGDTTVRLEAAFKITGVVLDKSGSPVAGGDVRARPAGAEGGQSHSADVDQKGRFDLKALPAGEFELWYEAEGVLHQYAVGRAENKTTRARAGTKGIAVPANLGLSLTVKITNWKGENRWHNGQLNQEDGRGSAWARPDADGTLRFHRLAEGKTYAFAMTNLPGGRYVLKTGLRPGDSASVRIQKGLTVRGRVIIPAEAAGGRINVSIQGPGFGIGGEVDNRGRFEIEGVPEGSWRVRAWAHKDKTHWQGEAETRAGSEVEITLEPRR